MDRKTAIFERMVAILDSTGVEYLVYRHRPVHSYEEAELARQESGFEGIEGKVVVCKASDTFAVYITLQGDRLDMRRTKQILGSKKLRLATPEELEEYFDADPGAVYPFGFDERYPILIDSRIFTVDWFLCSAALPIITLQIRGSDLEKLYDSLANPLLFADNSPGE